jgi:electron transfer flavoprotein alpha subunit
MSRQRRDPRAETLSLRVAGTARPRIDRAGGGGIAVAAPPPATAALRVVEQPAFLVVAVADAPHGRLSPHDRQLLGAARVLADAEGGAVLLLAPPLAEPAGLAGADRVAWTDTQPDAYDPEGQAAAVVAAILASPPRYVLFPESPDGGDLARRVAALTGEALFGDVEALSPRTVIRPARAGRVEQRAAPPRLIALHADRAAAHGAVAHEGREVALPPAPTFTRCLFSARHVPVDPERLALAEAGFVAAAGNGITDFSGFAALVRALGATPGASRMVCDAGHMPRDRQVGASGSVLDATCYLALGIAGAPQHLQGVARVQHVVAVNTDLHAAMVARAGLAVIADAQAVMPALLAALGPRAPVSGAVALESQAPSTRPEATKSPSAVRRAVVLLSAGRHPVSGRPAPVKMEAQAVRMALALGADVTGLHAGRDEQAVRDHLGCGLSDIALLDQAEGDPVPALAAALRTDAPDLVLAGRRGIGGNDGGILPYRLAHALGWPILADAVALAYDPDGLSVEQALPRGARRLVRVRLPCIVTVHPAAPPPLPFAFAAARRGRIQRTPAIAAGPAWPTAVEEFPYRSRPKLMGRATGGSAADRLKAATVVSSGGKVLINPAPEAAAAAILAYLREIGVVPRG